MVHTIQNDADTRRFLEALVDTKISGVTCFYRLFFIIHFEKESKKLLSPTRAVPQL